MKNDPSHLIIGYLQGILTEKEKEQFYNWVYTKEENKTLYLEIKAIYDAALLSNPTLNIEESWERLLNKKKKETTYFSIFLKRVAGYAAVGIIALLLSALFFRNTPEVVPVVAARYIGGNGLEADKIELPDGTFVHLGTQTTFYYETDYGHAQRVVYLEGEAYFEVAKEKDKPFIVKVEGQEIEALGTKFNVMAYREDSVLVTTLLEGSVRLTTHGLKSATVLRPDQQLVYHRRNQVARVYETDAQRYTAWTTGYYYFPEQSLSSILERLSTVYGIEFIVDSERLNKQLFTGTFYRGQSIKDIMEIICLSIPVHYQIEERRVTIRE